MPTWPQIYSHDLETLPHDSSAAVDPVVCHCFCVTQSQIIDMIETQQAVTVQEIVRDTCAGAGCTACHCRIKQLLDQRIPAEPLARPRP